jgi:hypothetical protein
MFSVPSSGVIATEPFDTGRIKILQNLQQSQLKMA